MTRLPEPQPHEPPGCAPARARRTARPGATLIVVIIFVAAAVPLSLIALGMSPAGALSTAGAVTAFAIGAAHQILGLLGASGRSTTRRAHT